MRNKTGCKWFKDNGDAGKCMYDGSRRRNCTYRCPHFRLSLWNRFLWLIGVK